MHPHADGTLFHKTEELLNIPDRQVFLPAQTLDVLITCCKINSGKR